MHGCAGLGATLLGLQATVGLLVAKTLTNATANPFLAGGAGSYNPVLALDVFLVQVSLPSVWHSVWHCWSFTRYIVKLLWALLVSFWLMVLSVSASSLQASTNTLLAHTISLLINLWLIRLVGKNVGSQPAGYVAKPA